MSSLRCKTGGAYPYEFYRKKNKIYLYMNDKSVNSSFFPPSFVDKIGEWNYEIDKARDYVKLLEKKDKLQITLHNLNEKLATLQSIPKPDNYDDEIAKTQQNFLYYYYISSDGKHIYYDKNKEKQIPKAKIPANASIV